MADSNGLNATLLERCDINPELAVIRVRPDEPVQPFEPGQFSSLGLPAIPSPDKPTIERPGRGPRLVRRAYSIASPGNQTNELEFYIVRVDDGKLTPRLWQLKPGDRLFVDPRIQGKFTLTAIPADKDLVMISTGTGLAPYISMLRTFRTSDPTKKRWRKLIIIHGVRLLQDLGYREELEAIAAEDPGVIYIPTVTREAAANQPHVIHGRVHVALEPAIYERLVGSPLTPEQCHIFLCGNPQMINDVQADLESRGFVTQKEKPSTGAEATPMGNIHYERYW